MGEFVEEQVMPCALRLMQEWGIEVHETYPRARAKRDGRSAEIDRLLVGDGMRLANGAGFQARA
ncbi:hypothetical protein [Endothiovibrio diazotrophicus]